MNRTFSNLRARLQLKRYIPSTRIFYFDIKLFLLLENDYVVFTDIFGNGKILILHYTTITETYILNCKSQYS